MSFKVEWFSQNLQCPTCSNTHFQRGCDIWACSSCQQAYPVINNSINFISPEMAIDFNIIANEKPSDHPYNPTAAELISIAEQTGGMVLDCGAGSREFTSDNLIQTEIMPYNNVDILAVNQSLPFQDCVFDAIFSFDVLEHVTDPFLCAQELARVLKPGGYLYLDLPFLQLEHGYPHHYFNATRMGLRRLFQNLLQIQAHVVPESGHPTHLIWTALNAYRNGLPKECRADFEGLTIEQILNGSWKDFRRDFGSMLNSETKWKMASATQAIMKKEPSNMEENSSISVDVFMLPNFRDRESFAG
ncbi:class I SAM-dependent methyltransferase [Sphingobium sp. MI1205]|uniref:class I SAM-dependent methyltransferase n=1 Tax=Sphingobium sp. MI1205 TaxID=407020 RepID=UPI00076FE628|nr:class I SAM-dependent methyltransferase [Sphingobium sp. MI1205]AMK18948.1 methylase [Sphingobium sp. MI1205]